MLFRHCAGVSHQWQASRNVQFIGISACILELKEEKSRKYRRVENNFIHSASMSDFAIYVSWSVLPIAC